MSAITTTEVRPATQVSVPGVSFTRVLRSEWTKLWSLRSTRWVLLISFIVMVLPGPVIAADDMIRWAHLSPHARATIDAIDTGVGGWHLAQLGVGVLGVLVISGEYSTGMIRSSLMAVPRRLPVLAAKALIYAGVVFGLMLAATFISYFGTQAILTAHHVQNFADPSVPRIILGNVLFLTVLGIMCVGLGGWVRNSAGGLAAFAGLIFVLPGLLDILPKSLANAANPYMPLNAGTTLASHTFENSHHLGPWGGFGLFCGYTLIILLGASVTLVRRDG